MSMYVTPHGFEPRKVVPNEPYLQPFADGYTAWIAGHRDESLNPYRPFSLASRHWLEGWDEAKVDWPHGWRDADK